MNQKINFNNLVRQLLPNHKRQPVRLFLLRAFIAPLIWLFGGFMSWRREIRIQMNMTGQIGVIEGYLRSKYGFELIRIVGYPESGMSIGLEHEGISHSVPVSMAPPAESIDTPANFPLDGEIEGQFVDVDFIVYIPASFTEETIDAIRRDINRYKQILSKYKIVKQ